MTIEDMQAEVDRFIQGFEVGYFSPLANLARLTEEVGELAREINHRYGEKPKKPGEPPGDISLELGDILFVVAAIANSLGIDLTAAFQAVMEKVQARDRERFPRKG